MATRGARVLGRRRLTNVAGRRSTHVVEPLGNFDVSPDGIGEERTRKVDCRDVRRAALEGDAETLQTPRERLEVPRLEPDVVDRCSLRRTRRVAAHRKEIN